MIDLILVGFGNVGQSLAEILELRTGWSRDRYGLDVKIVAIVDRMGAAVSQRGVDLSKAVAVKRVKGTISAMREYGMPNLSPLEVLEEVDGDVVVEVTSTNLETGEPGLTHIKKAFSLGRHVVTTNKGSLALSLPCLMDLARRNNVLLRFSGAVGGAVPVLDFARKCLFSEEIESIRGVLNGTTNYILWRMAEKHINRQQATREAQELGYAEENVQYDLDGLDTACKLVILGSWIMNRKVSLNDVEVEGIREISLQDVIDAEKEGFAIRLIGSINKTMRVSPEKTPIGDPLCVGSSLNAVAFKCTYSGQHILIGRGAGGKETVSSIVRDLVEISQGYGLSSALEKYVEY